jgi:hypothetical protein
MKDTYIVSLYLLDDSSTIVCSYIKIDKVGMPLHQVHRVEGTIKTGLLNCPMHHSGSF